MRNKFLITLWHYRDASVRTQCRIDQYFDEVKTDAMHGDAYAAYAAFIIDIVCYRKRACTSLSEMSAIIDSYDYPDEFADRLAEELENTVHY